MNSLKSIIQPIAPTLAAALDTPFSGTARKFILDNLSIDASDDQQSVEKTIELSLNDAQNLQKIKVVEEKFKQQMDKLEIDVFSLENDIPSQSSDNQKNNHKPQIIISVLFLIAYFMMLGAIFTVEVSDTLNMRKGDNSLMGELQILFGVLTAGVGQVLSYWFGGSHGKKSTD